MDYVPESLQEGPSVDYDDDKVDELFLHSCGSSCVTYISDPRGKARSVGVTSEGRSRAEELFRQHFSTKVPGGQGGC